METLIGRSIMVENSPNSSLMGLKGTIRDETEYTFLIETEKGMKCVLKHVATFTIEGKCFLKDGRHLVRKPEE